MVETARAPITTILFTDLVDSTTLMQRLHFQAAWVRALREHRLLR
jgi:hypothetical protein